MTKITFKVGEKIRVKENLDYKYLILSQKEFEQAKKLEGKIAVVTYVDSHHSCIRLNNMRFALWFFDEIKKLKINWKEKLEK